MEILTTALISLLTLGAIIIAYYKWDFQYWKRRGVPHLPPTFPYGNAKELFNGSKQLGVLISDFYKYFKSNGEKFFGVYVFPGKFFVPIDVELVRNIMVKDFDHFHDRGIHVNEELQPLTANLFSLPGKRWKNLRTYVTPTFTSAKMKMMYETMTSCGDELNKYLSTSAKDKTAIDMKEVLACYTTDVIGSCAFGLNCNSLADPEAEFRKNGRAVFLPSLGNNIRNLVSFLFSPMLLKLVRFKSFDSDIHNFFMKTVQNTIEYREKNQIFRKDFMHLLLQLKHQGKVSDDNTFKSNDSYGSDKPAALTNEQIAAQCFFFFLAGFETSATTMSFALYEISRKKDIQDKIVEELRTVLAKYNNKLTYDAIMELTYMDKVISEALRKHPPVPSVPRTCTKDYKIPNSDVTIKKGTSILISAMGMHNDPEYFPNPEVFDPERFSDENKQSRPAYCYFPFGDGPRVCLGMRFALLQSKVGLCSIFRSYSISMNKQTIYPMEYEPASPFILAIKGGLWLDMEKLEQPF